jgi:hypothetical protein
VKWLDKLIARFIRRLPLVGRLTARIDQLEAGLREASKPASKYDREVDELLAFEISAQRAKLQERMREALMFREAELACVAPDRAREMEATRESATSSVANFKERLWELELALEDRGWVREVTLATLEFSRYGVGQLIRITRIYAIKNPLIKRGMEICALYVFGRGVEMRAEDDTANDVIQGFLDENEAELGHVGLAAKEGSFQTDGALYFGLETINGKVCVRMIDPLEIMEVVCEPNDKSQPRWFKRQWDASTFNETNGTEQTNRMEAWYPALEYLEQGPTSKPTTMGRGPVVWEMPVLRVKGGCPSNWRWGLPLLYASIDWARAYKDFLEDWATVNRTLARFALMVETKGGPGAIAAYQALLQTTFADNNATAIERNPPPVVGSAHIGGPDTKINAFKSAGATSSPEQARRLLLMTAAAQGMPETFYGDASTGSLATAVSLDRPTELKFREMQQRWIWTLQRILAYVLNVSAATPNGKMREARKSNPAPQPIKIVVKFPSVLEHDITSAIQAWGMVASCGGRMGIAAGIVDRRTIAAGMLEEIGYEDASKLLDAIYGKDYDPAADVTDQRSQVPPQSLKQPSGKALTDLSTPPPLPPPQAPPALSPGAKEPPAGAAPPAAPAAAIAKATEALAAIAERVRARNGH